MRTEDKKEVIGYLRGMADFLTNEPELETQLRVWAEGLEEELKQENALNFQQARLG